ncbi:MAG: radical SAM protein [Thermodesulfobacteriota bacterium]|nr:radical SAM protein [Thermodesulfobacteriota bacterium]
MNYEGNIIRPPSEANSIILQVTVGCSHNKCSFCGAYKGVLFRIKENAVIDADLDFAASYCKRQNKVFLADGDALIIPHARLVALLEKIRKKLPWVKRIRLYGNAKSILMKTPAQLRELKNLGLDRVYMGLESGYDAVLKDIKKGVTAARMTEAGRQVKDADLFLSVTVLLGIGGRTHWREHAVETSRVLSAISPHQIAALTLMLIPGTPLYDQEKSGRFKLPDHIEILHELRLMVENVDVSKGQFQANHASNYLPINCRLPRDKQKILAMIDEALTGQRSLRPDFLRAL